VQKFATITGNFMTITNHLLKVLGLEVKYPPFFPPFFTNINNIEPLNIKS